MERGTVSSRVALLLRSAEVKPLFNRFVQPRVGLLLFHLTHAWMLRAGFYLCHVVLTTRHGWEESKKCDVSGISDLRPRRDDRILFPVLFDCDEL
jgi:hypothetical protein